MTEDEAKTKWCPAVRFTPDTEGRHAYNNREKPLKNDTEFGSVSRCIGSACMAWRWQRPHFTSVARGFCGLAGAPQ